MPEVWGTGDGEFDLKKVAYEGFGEMLFPFLLGLSKNAQLLEMTKLL